MNTKPDDVMLAQWLDDELAGDEFTTVDAWASTQPDQLAAREEIRCYRKQMAGLLPREIEPAYPDFFNSRILAGISEMRTAASVSTFVEKARVSWWRSTWFLPATAAAGIALGFLGGVNLNRTGPVADAGNGKSVGGAAPVVYTPDNEVKAKYIAGQDGSSTVIVLDGVSAIPDTIDFRETAWISLGGDIDSTASTTSGTPEEIVR